MLDMMQSTRVPEELLIRIVLDLLMVLKYLHNHCKVMHRDLNPSNILIDFNLSIKVTDFGLSQDITQGLNREKAFEGTLAYSSPETIENVTADDKADIWSLGCVIYELIELRQTFQSTNPLTLAKMITHGEFQPPKKDTTNPKLYNLVMDCLTVNPEDRPCVSDLLVNWIDEMIDYNCTLKTKLTNV